jgi:YHS domain-containing protein
MAEQAKDPVCDMTFPPGEAVATVEHEGATYYFCSQDCAESFQEDPEDYI